MSYSTADSKRKLVLFALLTLYATALLTSMAGMEIFGWTTVAASVGFILWKKDWSRLRAPGAELPIFGFLLSALVSEVVNGYPLPHVLTTLGDFRWIILFFAFSWSARESNFVFSQKRALWWLVAVMGIEALEMAQQFATGVDYLRPHATLDGATTSYWRAEGFFNSCITTCYAIGVPGLFYFGRALQNTLNDGRDSRRRAYWLFFAFSTLGVYLCWTRGAWLAWVVATFFAILVSSRKPKALAILLGIYLAVFIPAYALNHDQIGSRVTSIGNTETDTSNSQRIVLWKANIQLFKDHPLFGVGWNENSNHLKEAFAEIGRPDFTFISHSHNNFLQTLGGLGAFGIFFYCYLCLFMMWRAFALFIDKAASAEARAVGLGALAAQIFFHVGGLTQCNFIDAEVQHNLVFVWALLFASLKSAAPSRTR